MQWSSVQLITCVLRAGRFPCSLTHRCKTFYYSSFLISTLAALALNLPMKSHLRSG